MKSRIIVKKLCLTTALTLTLTSCGQKPTKETTTSVEADVYNNSITYASEIADSEQITDRVGTSEASETTQSTVTSETEAAPVSNIDLSSYEDQTPFITPLFTFEISKQTSLEEYQDQLIAQWGFATEPFYSSSAFVSSLNLTANHYTFGNIIAELIKNNIPFTTCHDYQPAGSDKAAYFSSTILQLKDGPKLYFMDQLNHPMISQLGLTNNKEYYDVLWKVDTTADYTLFKTCSAIGRYINDESLLQDSNELYQDSLHLLLSKFYIYAKHGYQFETPELDAFFSLNEWYQRRTENLTMKDVENEMMDSEKVSLHAFSKIEDDLSTSSKDKYKLTSYVNGSTFDLDKDGAVEQVWYFTYVGNSANERGTDFYIEEKSTGGITSINCDWNIATPFSDIYHTVGADKVPYICLEACLDSGNYETVVCNYDGQTINYITTFMGSIPSHFDGYTLTAPETQLQFESVQANLNYLFIGTGFQQQGETYYNFAPMYHVAMTEVKGRKTNSASDSKVIINTGDVIKLLGGDLSEWVQYENLTTGETGWLKVSETNLALQGNEINTYSVFSGVKTQ